MAPTWGSATEHIAVESVGAGTPSLVDELPRARSELPLLEFRDLRLRDRSEATANLRDNDCDPLPD